MQRRRKPRTIIRLEDLPEEIQNQVTQAGIERADAQANIDSLLNAIHIRLKERFYTKDGFEKMKHTRLTTRRRNVLASKISPDIVSVAPLEEEEKELLSGFAESDYFFLKKLGKGGFGHVFLAEEKTTKEKVAVKKMPHVTEKHQRKNFQEIRFLDFCAKHGALGIVEFKRANVVDDEMWVLTEQVDGGTLTQAVTRHKFSEPEIAYVVEHLLKGLHFLHEHQIAHRDMKSGNIVLGKDGSVKIIDFGLCSDISGGELVHRVGSPFWLPPEMINHELHGLPVDVWSFGICCMEMVNGHPPHHRSALRAMFVAATKGYEEPVEDPSAWSSETCDFIGWCVKKDPKQRWTVAQLLEHAFVKKKTNQREMSKVFTKVFSQEDL
eukprot:TRINITY_DN2036_c0_g2_i1.p1 TRINITY_DN2036_c0_g2~~TRINITY_DN2036_c0_g2_i1.p1  ORF type:complete len:380 (+),score=82.88 TRINITY_DN2036_c0_g2_i1:64-1203(+)